ncbi:MAG: DNA polymerase III subunit chi [Gammaproteobacteria bacterium]|nr:MAG: DNA polymerase III subunit chi [Gammaproteobacteria bacterium]
MTRVDFYILSEPDKLGFVCRLVEKTFHLGHRIYVHAESEEQAAQLDGLMWTFKQGSFVPHALCDADSDVEFPILIGHKEPSAPRAVLINLRAELPEFFARFERVAEIVAPDEASKRSGRERFRLYRERGCALETHTISG